MVGSSTSKLVSSAPKFAIGSRVEVSSEEEGFTGAWYVATILDLPPKPKKKPNQIYVEYDSLLDEDSSKPLREYINSDFVRPIPPRDSQKIESFHLHDVVDAFYKDGWWTGVITSVVDNSRFEVTFHNPPDLIVFEASDLRVHKDWIRGRWVRPKKQRITGLLFSKGKRVEVSVDKYCEVWFPATVQEEIGSGSYLVEHQTPGSNDVPESLKIKVDSLHIRPSPPQLKVKNYVLSEKVDAYIDFGWWSGVITKALPDNKFLVLLKQSKIEKEVNQSEIRPHMEWKDGNWYSTAQDALASSDYQGPPSSVSCDVQQKDMVSPSSLSTLKGNSDERTANTITSLHDTIKQSNPSNAEPATVLTSEKRKMKLLNPGSDGHSRPSKRVKEANKSDIPPLLTYNLDTSPVNSPGEDVHVGSANPSNGSAGTNSLAQNTVDLPPENLYRGKRNRGKRHKPVELGNYTPGPSRRNGSRLPKSPTSEAHALVEDKSSDLDKHTPDPLQLNGDILPISQIDGTNISGDKSVDAVTCPEENLMQENLVQEECLTEVDPVTSNLDHKVIEGIRSEELHRNPNEESQKDSGNKNVGVHDQAVERIKEGDQLESPGDTIQKRKRGRPPKYLTKSPEVSQRNGGVAAADIASKDLRNEETVAVVVGLQANQVNGSLPNKDNVKTGADKKISNGSVEQKSKSSSKLEVYSVKKDKVQSGKSVQASAKKAEIGPSKRGRRTISKNVESSNQDHVDLDAEKTAEVSGNESLVREADTSTVQLPCSISDDQPLSMWLEAPKTTDVTSASQERNVEQSTDSNQKDKSMVSAQSNDQSLPFTKSSPLWKTIESTGFCQLPQRPHFQTLSSKKESTREGAAIALMVNFAGMVRQASNLQFDDPNVKSIIEEILENLVEYEKDGFNVELIRGRLQKLLEMKDKQKEFGSKSVTFEDQIKERNDEKTKLDDKILEIETQIRLLEEERASILAAKEEKDSAIATLQSAVDGINNDVTNVRLKFEALVTSPWPK